jgi:uncharacterized protein
LPDAIGGAAGRRLGSVVEMQQQMTCPKCLGPMRQYERSGVIVDQCQECRGIFLDRGELERLVDAETSFHSPRAPQVHQADRSRGYDRSYEQQHPHKKKRSSFFEELFD